MSSFRAELAGLHDMLGYALKHGSRDAKYEIFCDNESVLKVLDLAKEPTIVELSKAEGKLVQQTRTILQKFRNVSLRHVEGHQDNVTRYEDFDLQSRLNVDCGTEAKRKMCASMTAPLANLRRLQVTERPCTLTTWKSPRRRMSKSTTPFTHQKCLNSSASASNGLTPSSLVSTGRPLAWQSEGYLMTNPLVPPR